MQRVVTSLLQRRLMPAAILLLVGIVAVPALMLKSSSAQPLPAPGTPAPAPAGLATAVKSALTGGDPHQVSVGNARDPFAGNKRPSTPAGQVTAGVGTQASTPAAATPAPASSGPTATAPASTAPASTTTHTTTTSSPAPGRHGDPRPHRVFTVYDVSIRFAQVGMTAHLRRDLPRLSPLPTPQHPVSLFLGVIGGGSERRATFLVPVAAQHSGNGVCRPRRRLCRVIALRPGQSETLTVGSDTGVTRRYRVSVVHLHAYLTTDAAAAQAAHDRVSPSGECLYAALFPVAFDPSTGRLTEVAPHRTCNYIVNGHVRPIDASGLR